ncbi:hypothetical protein SEA_BIGGITYBASS_80 [Gordonia phage BiggityBass]|nr:hypothetical protein SEA_BIGGITYBASS_80 [Gordonia phage BiggityBass]
MADRLDLMRLRVEIDTARVGIVHGPQPPTSDKVVALLDDMGRAIDALLDHLLSQPLQ